jgi:hypothetical protein
VEQQVGGVEAAYSKPLPVCFLKIIKTMNKKIFVIELLSSDSFLVVNKNLLKYFGPDTIIFLSNLVDKFKYFDSKNELKDNELFYLTHEKQMDDIGFDERTIRKCKSKLKIENIIETKLIGIPPKEYYKIQWENIAEIIQNSVRDKGTDSVRDKGTDSVRDKGTDSVTLNNNNKYNNKNKVYKNKVAEQLICANSNNSITQSKFDTFWHLYPNKAGKGAAVTAWNKICNRQNGQRPTWEEIENAILEQKKSKQWQDRQYIPHASTWLNQSRWLDDPKYMNGFSKDEPVTRTRTVGYVGDTPLKYKRAKSV